MTRRHGGVLITSRMYVDGNLRASGWRFDVSIEPRVDRYRSIAPIGQPPRFVILTDL